MPKLRAILFTILTAALCLSCSGKATIYTTAEGTAAGAIAGDSDLKTLLKSEGFRLREMPSLGEIISKAPEGSAVILEGGNYPCEPFKISETQLEQIRCKNLRIFADFCTAESQEAKMHHVEYERVVVTSEEATGLKEMDLLSINRGWFYEAPASSEATSSETENLLVLARVAGFDKAEFGLEDTEVYPLVTKLSDGIYISTSPLVNFEKIRFMPEAKWQTFWETVLSDLTGKQVGFKNWPTAVRPAYDRTTPLPDAARREAVSKGVEWFFNGHFLVHPSWKADWIDKYQGDGTNPVGPGLPDDMPDGDGSLGMLEGHCSAIYEDGAQAYRYWMRADVQGESAMALATAAKLLQNQEYQAIGGRLLDYAFEEFCDGPRSDPKSPTYGLVGWSGTHKYVYYGDDNARFILGASMCAALSGDKRWDERITRAIEANYNTASFTGFRTDRIEDPDIQKNGLEYYQKREIFSPHPHFESWLWACYLMHYAKTGEAKYLEAARKGLKATMAVYPEGLLWTNGIQQEKARLVLPLSWLYRADPTDEHLGWLKQVISDLKANQDECGAIREELGDPSKGYFGTQKCNNDYGTNEAPLIFRNGDPVADMLYTSNFAVFGLNEAAKATGDAQIEAVCDKLCEFLVRIQARSEMYRSLDGAWYRAFNYQDWNYWASNADAGWGAQGTLTGWTQSWIVATLALREMGLSGWEILTDKTNNQ